MKLSRIFIRFILNGCLVLTFQIAAGQSAEIHPLTFNNQLISNPMGQHEDFYCNPILLCGDPLNYDTFNLNTSGELKLTKGNPEAPEPRPIPFGIAIRRNGSLLDSPELHFLNQELYKIEIAEVLQFAKHGDHLIITPTRRVDWKAKRVIRLSGSGC